MSQVRAVRINQHMQRISGYEHILAMQKEKKRAEAAAQQERPALAAIGLVLVIIGALETVFSVGSFSNGNMGAMVFLAVTGVIFLGIGLALITLSAPHDPEPVNRRTRYYY